MLTFCVPGQNLSNEQRIKEKLRRNGPDALKASKLQGSCDVLEGSLSRPGHKSLLPHAQQQKQGRGSSCCCCRRCCTAGLNSKAFGEFHTKNLQGAGLQNAFLSMLSRAPAKKENQEHLSFQRDSCDQRPNQPREPATIHNHSLGPQGPGNLLVLLGAALSAPGGPPGP